MELVEVPRVDAGIFHPSRFGGLPCVVKAAARHWPALERWTADYLKSSCGQRKVVAREMRGPPLNVYQSVVTSGELAFSDYLDWVLEVAENREVQRLAESRLPMQQLAAAIQSLGFEHSYYLDTPLVDLGGDLLQDIAPPNWYRRPPIAHLFWCGVLGTSCGLHFDVTPNCNVQIVGRKRFILFPSSQSHLLYRKQRGSHCRFDPNSPDFERFPRARQARGWQCDLEVGDALHIPAGWFHQVTITSAWAANVNVFWSRPFPQGLIQPALWGLLMRRGCSQAQRAIRRQGVSRSPGI